MQPLHELIERTLSSFHLKKQTQPWKALELWPKVVGREIAKLSIPLHLADGILFVGTRGSAWAQELTFQKMEILSRLNAELGTGTIRDIRFQSLSWKDTAEEHERKKTRELSPEEKKWIEEVTSRIENREIQKSFKKLLTLSLRYHDF